MAQIRRSKVQKVIDGTYKTRGNSASAVPLLSKLPTAPRDFDEVAKRCWDDFGNKAIRVGTLSEFDLGVLELLCRTWGSTVKLDKILERDGYVIKSGSGARKAHPALAALDRARGQAAKLLADLGLSAPGRERISIDPRIPGRKNTSDEFFN
jgi:P27 family predicted phage terminase small subunit